jgi:MFS family permease
VSGAFFILHWATQLPGGILAARYGTKLIFGLANWIGCVTCIFVPMAAYMSFETLICLRLIQGFVAGAAWPCKYLPIYLFFLLLPLPSLGSPRAALRIVDLCPANPS